MEIKSQTFQLGNLLFEVERCSNPDLGWTVSVDKNGEQIANFYSPEVDLDDIIAGLTQVKNLVNENEK